MEPAKPAEEPQGKGPRQNNFPFLARSFGPSSTDAKPPKSSKYYQYAYGFDDSASAESDPNLRPKTAIYSGAGPKGRRHIWRAWIKPILVVVLVVGCFRSAIADWNDVPTGSMKPTILEGDRIFVNKLAYDLRVPFTRWRVTSWGDPRAGEVVVLVSPHDGKRLVKRVVAVPGDRIAIRGKRVWINGQPLAYERLDPRHLASIDEQTRAMNLYLDEKLGEEGHAVRMDPTRSMRANHREVIVPEGFYFVMGDNRDNSFDSRAFGFVARERILGKAEGVVLSVDPARSYRPRWERFFSELR